jgi:mRNA interferase HigB
MGRGGGWEGCSRSKSGRLAPPTGSVPKASGNGGWYWDRLAVQETPSGLDTLRAEFGSQEWNSHFHFLEFRVEYLVVIVIGTDIVERYFARRAGHRGIKAARSQYEAWRALVEMSKWNAPEDVKKAHPKASILKGGRVVFNIKANDYRLIAVVQYKNGVVMIRFFGSHEEYDKVDAEAV